MEWYEWNPFLCKKLDTIIKENWVFVDVGANRGEFTDFFKSKKYLTIYLFELNPTLCKDLTKKYQNDGNIIIENYAVSNKNEKVKIYDGGTNASDECFNILGHNTKMESTKEIGTVESIRLDTYFKDIEIGLVKIDVEGAELLVLDGMTKILSNIHYILIECHFDQDWPKLKDKLLNEYKFTCQNMFDDSPITMESPRPYQCLCINNNYDITSK